MRLENDYVGQPVRSLQTMLAVIARADEEIPVLLADGVYDVRTEEAVLAFQRQNRLSPTGQTDQETWNQIVGRFHQVHALVLPAEPLSPIWQPLQTIEAEAENGNLYLIQAMLAALGTVYADVPALTVHGRHDTDSVKAVKWLQKAAGLPEDGVLTQVEWRILTRLYRLAIGDGR